MNVTGGSTDVTTYFVMRLAATGVEATGLTITDFDLQYVRSGATPAAKVDATALGAANSAHGDNQAIEVDTTDQPGLYRVDWPDAAFAAGVREAILTVKCATCFTEHLRVSIDAPVNVTSLSADQQSLTDLKDFADAGYDPSTNKVQGVVLVDTMTTYTGNTPQTGDTYALANGANGFAVIEALVDDIGVAGAGLTALASAANLSTLQTSVDDLPTSAELATALAGADDAVLAAVAGVQSDTNDIQTRLPAALASGLMKVDILAVNGTTVDGDGQSGTEWGPSP